MTPNTHDDLDLSGMNINYLDEITTKNRNLSISGSLSTLWNFFIPYYSTNNKKFEGKFDKGKAINGTYFFENGEFYKGSLKNNKYQKPRIKHNRIRHKHRIKIKNILNKSIQNYSNFCFIYLLNTN